MFFSVLARLKIFCSVTLHVTLALFASCTASASAAYPSVPPIAKDGTVVLLENYATVPFSARGGSITNFGPGTNFTDQLSRPNFLVSEPTNAPLSATRFFVPDLNRSLFILDKDTRTFTNYINFQSVFPRFYNAGGFAGGLVTVAFDPEYATNGLFYTVHVERGTGDETPTNANLPALDLAGYTTTPAITAPAPATRPLTYTNVLVEWKDANINNATFEGTAREIMRIAQNDRIHPMGDLLFNPLAKPGDSDYRNLYIAIGDGSAGEYLATRTTPQRLDAVQGKILRITPDLNLRPADELGANGRYRIPTSGPDPNPFVAVSLPNLKKEIFAYGFRNPHRISWDPIANVLLCDDIGLHSYEELNIVHKGGNFGYSEREGTQQLFVGDTSATGFTGDWYDIPFTNDDTLAVAGLAQVVTPLYPVALYSHTNATASGTGEGDAISSGDVYRGSLMPQLIGKYIFGDITTGRIFYCDLNELMATDDGVRTNPATIHEIQIMFDSPYDAPDMGITNRRFFDVVSETYHARGGNNSVFLPGDAAVTALKDRDGVLYGGGRADTRIVTGRDGELYVISKSDGAIRKMTAALSPPYIKSVSVTNGMVNLVWQCAPGRTYRVQYGTNVSDANWTDLPGDVTAANITSSKVSALTDGMRFYRVVQLP